MKIRELAERAAKKNLADVSALSDYFEVCRLLEAESSEEAHQRNREIRRLASRYAKEQNSLKMFELSKKSLLFDAPHNFDCYLRYIEWDRSLEKRFYMPRRHYLLPIVDAYQDVLDLSLIHI